MKKNYLITGGCGFIGSNLVARLIEKGEKVSIYDNLSRAGSRKNLEWLRTKFGDNSIDLIIGDIRDNLKIQEAAKKTDVIVHLAAQVAVTTSVTHPREDFEINAYGTFNVLEAARLSGRKPIFIYASTNKVYGGMEDVEIVEESTHYRYAAYPKGISEERPIDFHSPYGCSKGCGDQYVRDYSRIYDIPAVVFRQSCIYGTRQFGVEDQGWVAWFIIAAVTGRPIKVYGDGKQVRDILFVDDLVNAYEIAINQPKLCTGQIFNIGGGTENTISIYQEFFPILEKLLGKKIEVSWGEWRPGDQKVYISDIQKAEKIMNWKPNIGTSEGIKRLYEWVKTNEKYY